MQTLYSANWGSDAISLGSATTENLSENFGEETCEEEDEFEEDMIF